MTFFATSDRGHGTGPLVEPYHAIAAKLGTEMVGEVRQDAHGDLVGCCVVG